MGGYLGTHLSELLGRIDGPLHLRIFIQPLMAIVLAARDGWRDARRGRAPFGITLLTDLERRRHLLRDGWRGISKVFCVACVLDVVYQVIELRGLRPGQTVIVAAVLAVLPYALLRGPVTRLVRWRPGGKNA